MEKTYLGLVIGEAIDLLLQVLDLSGLLLVNLELLGKILLLPVGIFVHLSDPDTLALFLLLGFRQLDLHIPERLLELVHLGLCYPELRDDLLGANDVSGLHHLHLWWELRLLPNNKFMRQILT